MIEAAHIAELTQLYERQMSLIYALGEAEARDATAAEKRAIEHDLDASTPTRHTLPTC